MVRYNQNVDAEAYPEMRYFAQNIVAARTQLNMSQGQLAALLRLTQPYISALEGMKANPTLQVVSHIAKGLGVPGYKLLQQKAPKFPANPPGIPAAPDEAS